MILNNVLTGFICRYLKRTCHKVHDMLNVSFSYHSGSQSMNNLTA